METEKNRKWEELSRQIPVPDSLKPEQIEKKLEQTKRRRYTTHARRLTNRFLAVTTTAACALLLLLFIIGNSLYGSGILPQNSNISDGIESAGSKLASQSEPYGQMEHATYTQLQQNISGYYRRLQSEEDRLYENTVDAAMPEIAKEASSGSQKAVDGIRADGNISNSYTKTDLQVQGVDEGDIVKTDGSYIYSCSSSAYGSVVKIYQASGETTKKISGFTIDAVTINELYLDENRLIIVGSDWGETAEEEQNYTEDTLSSSARGKHDILQGQQTIIAVYDISDTAHPRQVTKRTQSGSYFTSRKNGRYMYTLSTMNVPANLKKDDKKSYVPCTDGDLLPEDRLYIPEQASSNCYLVLTALDITAADSFSDRISTLGAGGVCYVSENSIYVGTHVSGGMYGKTTISKYSYADGTLTAVANRIIDGRLNDQFSMDEYNGYLRFVATTYTENGSTSNGLYILDDTLNPVGSVDKLARDERIYSARFMGDRAYFVTYRETDPVFLVDVTDPQKPVVKDKLKIPGFSDYLHPFGESLLLGIGSNVTSKGNMQVKLSMFDISSDTAVSEKHKTLLEKETYSIAGENHKAVLVDTERNRIGLCIYSAHDDFNDKEKGNGYSYRVYSYDTNGFHETASLSPHDLSQSARGLFIGDYFYLVDDEGLNSGLHVYKAENFQKIK